jgi:hypothetical protein
MPFVMDSSQTRVALGILREDLEALEVAVTSEGMMK